MKKVDAMERVRQKLMWDLWEKYSQERGNSIWHLDDVVEETAEHDIKRLLIPLDIERYLDRFIDADFNPSPNLVKKIIDKDKFFYGINLNFKIRITTNKELEMEAEYDEKRKRGLREIKGISERELKRLENEMPPFCHLGSGIAIDPCHPCDKAFPVMKVKVDTYSLKIELPPMIEFHNYFSISQLRSEPIFDYTGKPLPPDKLKLDLHYTDEDIDNFEIQPLVRYIFGWIDDWKEKINFSLLR